MSLFDEMLKAKGHEFSRSAYSAISVEGNGELVPLDQVLRGFSVTRFTPPFIVRPRGMTQLTIVYDPRDVWSFLEGVLEAKAKSGDGDTWKIDGPPMTVGAPRPETHRPRAAHRPPSDADLSEYIEWCNRSGLLASFIQQGPERWHATVRYPDMDLSAGWKGLGATIAAALREAMFRCGAE